MPPPRFWLVSLAGIALTPLGARHSPKTQKTDEAQNAETVLSAVIYIYIAFLISSLVTPYIRFFKKKVAYLLATVARAFQTAC